MPLQNKNNDEREPGAAHKYSQSSVKTSEEKYTETKE